jgi:hypothetical protein
MSFSCEEIASPKAIKTRASLSVRFDRLVDRAGGCWIWRGAINNKGYGYLTAGKRGAGRVLAHRVSWELNNGMITGGEIVLHTCDNPPCVNPDHLRLGTQLDNLRDMAAKGRAGGQKLTRSQIEEIRTADPVAGYQSRLAEKFGVAQSLISYHRTKRSA